MTMAQRAASGIHRPTRRALLRAGAALGVGGGFLTACARQAAVAPATAQPVTELTFAPWVPSGSFTQPAVSAVMHDALGNFEAQHKGVHVKLVPGNGCCNPAADMAALLAGKAADVFTENDYWAFAGTNVLLDLAPYLQKDNVSLSLWPTEETAALQQGGGITALPVYYNLQVLVANLTIFNAAGQTPPSRTWDSTQYVQAASSVTGTVHGQHRWGCVLAWYGTSGENGMPWLLHGFGGALTDATRTRCLLGTKGSIAAGDWVYQQIVWPGVGQVTNTTYWSVWQAFLAGTAAIVPMPPSSLIAFLSAGGAAGAIDWDFYPNPTFPQGAGTMAEAQYYMIPAATKQPELSWELLKWLTAEPVWQTAMMKLYLVPPALISLFDQWEQIVRSVVPSLQTKHLSVYTDAARSGALFPYPGFRYNNAQALGVVATMLNTLAAHKSGVTQAFTLAATQIDRIEVAGAAEASGHSSTTSSSAAAAQASGRTG